MHLGDGENEKEEYLVYEGGRFQLKNRIKSKLSLAAAKEIISGFTELSQNPNE